MSAGETKPIIKLDVVHYSEDGTRWTSQVTEQTTWESIVSECSTMDRFLKPLITIQRLCEPASELIICGGNGIYHVQFHAGPDDDWLQAWDPNGVNEEIEVWMSDQGFTTSRNYTWTFDDLLTIVRFYIDEGNRHPDYQWI